jgi:hypothetical protein
MKNLFIGDRNYVSCGAQDSLSDQSSIYAAWASVIIAGVLAIITFLQMREAKKIRLESGRPALSLMPRRWVAGGPFLMLFLVNNGGLARNVEVDATYAGEKRSMYIMSLAENDMLRIVENCDELSKKGGKLVQVNYRDAYDKKHQDDMEVDFNKLKQGNFPYVTNRLDELNDSLDYIKHRLR